jgi:hypothetical protein
MFTETLVRERIATLHDEAERARAHRGIGRNGRRRPAPPSSRRPWHARGF